MTSPTPTTGPSGLADDLRYIAAMLHANRDKFAVPDHIAAKVAKLHKAANALTPQPGEAAAFRQEPDAGAVERAATYTAGGLDFVQYEIERVICRRIFEKRIEGYTLEMAKEIADTARAALASLVPADPAKGET